MIRTLLTTACTQGREGKVADTDSNTSQQSPEMHNCHFKIGRGDTDSNTSHQSPEMHNYHFKIVTVRIVRIYEFKCIY